MFGSRIQEIDIVYRPGKENCVTDALSRNPQTDISEDIVDEVQVANVSCVSADASTIDITELLK